MEKWNEEGWKTARPEIARPKTFRRPPEADLEASELENRKTKKMEDWK